MAREQQLGIEPDPQVEAYMRAAAFGGKNSVDVELTLRLLGLEACADTVVGNRMLRGCSGGERKRVTTVGGAGGRNRLIGRGAQGEGRTAWAKRPLKGKSCVGKSLEGKGLPRERT